VVAAAVLAAVLFAVLALRPGTGGVSDATAAPAAVEDGVLVPYLRFGGTATVQARPDRADLTVISRVEAATARAALRGAGARHRAVLARLKALGIPAADLQTASTSVEEERRKGRVLFVAVVATNVTVRDVDAVGRVVTEASEEGATISGPSFTLENRRAAYDDALAKAIGDARAKAEASLGPDRRPRRGRRLRRRPAGIADRDEHRGRRRHGDRGGGQGRPRRARADHRRRVRRGDVLLRAVDGRHGAAMGRYSPAMAAPVVTLLTDFGLQDAFAGVMEGVILREAPEARVIHLTHGIRPQAVLLGALALAGAVPYTPVGVHVAVVDPGVGSERRAIVIVTGMDAVSSVRQRPAPARGGADGRRRGRLGDRRRTPLPAPRLPHLPRRDVFAPVAARLASGLDPGRVGPQVKPGSWPGWRSRRRRPDRAGCAPPS
jgi:uncharacterized protein YggE